ncbi:MAG TPA: MOFRL family protein, partial [Sandaracinaceae bacterium]
IARRLMHAGADIAELNAVRSALSRLKGGGLARAIAPARVCNVVLSDVPGHPLSIVASGPTCAPPTEAPRARDVLERYGLLGSLGPGARAALERRRAPIRAPIRTELAADNGTARAAVVERARALGVAMEDRPGFFAGEARAIGASIAPSDRAWVWGGESTVVVRGAGRGGRNQELVLAALSGWKRGLFVCFGTDGVDGSSDAAGALIDEHALRVAKERGLDPARALANNDAGTFFEALGTALRSGPTGTNVADLCFYLT